MRMMLVRSNVSDVAAAQEVLERGDVGVGVGHPDGHVVDRRVNNDPTGSRPGRCSDSTSG